MQVEESEQHAPVLFCQGMTNNLVREVVLSKEKAYILSSRLKQWNRHKYHFFSSLTT